jgi:hypothetical protein
MPLCRARIFGTAQDVKGIGLVKNHFCMADDEIRAEKVCSKLAFHLTRMRVHTIHTSMKHRSLTTILAVCASVYGLTFLAPTNTARAEERAPDVYRSAPIVPGSKNIGQHRFRSARNYEDTLDYYKKLFKESSAYRTTSEKIVNNSEVRGIFFKNTAPKARWDGLNVYEYKGSVTIFVVLSDEELKKIAADAAPKATPPGSSNTPKGTQKDGAPPKKQ